MSLDCFKPGSSRAQSAPHSGGLRLFRACFWVLIAAVISTFLDFDWSQDIAAYYENLSKRDLFGEEIAVDHKAYWYRFFVYPVQDHFGGIEVTLTIVKVVNISLFLIALRGWPQSHLEWAGVALVVLITPALFENFVEFLRQGTAIGVFLLGLSYKPRIARWPLFVLSVMLHGGVLLLLVAVLAGVGLSKIPFERIKTNLPFPVAPIAVMAVVLVAALGSPLWSEIIGVVPGMFGFLSGSRGNPLGMLYLAAYATYLGFLVFVYRSSSHAPPFVGLLILCACYVVLTDFGRALSLILPLHLVAALTLTRPTLRVMDLVALFFGGSIYLIA